MNPKLNSTPFGPELDALVERGRVVQQVPDVVRARALARARATVASSMVAEPARPAQLPVRGMRIAVAATVAMAVGAAAATAALHRRTSPHLEPAPPATERVAPPSHGSPVGVAAPQPAVIPEPLAREPLARPHRQTRPAAVRESYAAELELLQRAQAAYANQDYHETLALVGKHGRQFPNGRLAEEREALRVRSLAAAGRTDEERRAVAAFTHRFPRSVLLSRFQKTTDGAE
jgi:hypothetical protein